MLRSVSSSRNIWKPHIIYCGGRCFGGEHFTRALYSLETANCHFSHVGVLFSLTIRNLKINTLGFHLLTTPCFILPFPSSQKLQHHNKTFHQILTLLMEPRKNPSHYHPGPMGDLPARLGYGTPNLTQRPPLEYQVYGPPFQPQRIVQDQRAPLPYPINHFAASEVSESFLEGAGEKYDGPFGRGAHVFPVEERRFCASPKPISRSQGGDKDVTKRRQPGDMNNRVKQLPSLNEDIKNFVYMRSKKINRHTRRIGDIDRYANPRARERLMRQQWERSQREREREREQELELERRLMKEVEWGMERQRRDRKYLPDRERELRDEEIARRLDLGGYLAPARQMGGPAYNPGNGNAGYWY